MNILQQIIAQKREEISKAKSLVSIAQLEQIKYFERPIISTKEILANKNFGIIAEFKRKSPSKGIINDKFSVEFVTNGYANAGAVCLSVLTDLPYFGGCKEDLMQAREFNPQTPILRKDFIIDEYQIVEAKAWGADMILLIAANLDPNRLRDLAVFAKGLGLDVLMEVHDKEELLTNLDDHIDLIGVNNRNLKTFQVNLDTSLELTDYIPNQFVKISESGLNSAPEIQLLRKAGYLSFLIGESFMKTEDPGLACKKLIAEIEDHE